MDININTHQDINTDFCGTPVHIEEDVSRVVLRTLETMMVDDSGLVHGGFIFGLADYAAMIAVNHPNVVLGGAEVKFIKPVIAGDVVTAEAEVIRKQGKKHIVRVDVTRDDDTVFKGEFTCFVLEKHILEE